MTQLTRVVVPIDPDDAASWSYAIAYAQAIGSGAQPPARSYVLLTHAKEQLKRSSLARHMGEPAAKALLANNLVGIGNGDQLGHATMQTLRVSRGTVVIAFYADEKMVDRLDGVAGVIGIVGIPDLPNSIDGWIARWNPRIHGRQQGAPKALITDPVVEKALTSLSSWINLSHAVMNPRDKGYADETLRILRAKGHTFEPVQMRSWAIRHGWQPGSADELGRLAARIGDLKIKPSLKAYHDPDGRYDRWTR